MKMASPNSSFTDIITTTLQGYSGEMADNITNHNGLWRQIKRKGNMQTATGRTIVQEARIRHERNHDVVFGRGNPGHLPAGHVYGG
jgi:putative N-acetylmannosamine-6-phosphate epimerase